MIADKPIALVDLDGIILEHDQEDGDGFDPEHFGPVMADEETNTTSRDVLSWLHDRGWCVVIWTVRNNTGGIMNALNTRAITPGVYYDYINHHPHQPTASPKLYADLIIDDRGLGCPANPARIIEMLEERDDRGEDE